MRRKLMTAFKYSCLTVVTLFALFVVLVLWELGAFGNWGLESGYFEEFNRVRNVLNTMPDIEIVDYWQHRDMTLEDFGFDIVVDGNLEVTLNYHDNTPEKTERDPHRIRAQIESEIDRARMEQAAEN